jgi:hypothetical protein
MTFLSRAAEMGHEQMGEAMAGVFDNGRLPMWIHDLHRLAFLAQDRLQCCSGK